MLEGPVDTGSDSDTATVAAAVPDTVAATGTAAAQSAGASPWGCKPVFWPHTRACTTDKAVHGGQGDAEAAATVGLSGP